MGVCAHVDSLEGEATLLVFLYKDCGGEGGRVWNLLVSTIRQCMSLPVQCMRYKYINMHF